MFTSKDQLTHYMIAGHLHLSKKDYGFFNNIKTIVHDKKPVTSNQDKLFNKLLSKYQRQLTKLNHNPQQLLTLPWKVGMVESKQEYLDANIFIEGDVITIRSPFNNKFLQMFRKVPLNSFVWDKIARVYQAPLNSYQLKIAIDTVNKCYESVKYCDKIKEILQQLDGYADVKYWQPTLVKRNDHFYVLATNHTLNEVIKDIPLNDDPNTFYILSQYGIKIDESLIKNSFDKFSAEYLTEVDSFNMSEMCDWLKQLNVECVFTSRDVVYNKELGNELKLELLQRNIDTRAVNSTSVPNSVLIKTHSGYSSLITNSDFNKIIHLTNSRPVKIR